MKDWIKGIVIFIVVLAVLVGIGFGTGYLDVLYKKTVGVASASADREAFKEGKAYVEGMASDLADYKYQYDKAKDDTDKKAITGLIRTKYADFDANTLESADLRIFLQGIKDGSIQ